MRSIFRFQCLYRVYKYIFLEFGLDVEKMILAGQQYVGEHDFRNFCKLDADKVRHFRYESCNSSCDGVHLSFRRKILWVKFRRVDPTTWEVEIAGLSFLWHQV